MNRLQLYVFSTSFVFILILLAYMMNQNHEQEMLQLVEENTQLQAELFAANHKLNTYLVNIEYIKDLGASEDEAIKILKASEVYNVDPK